MVIAQFWAYANDVHTTEQGERLFAVIAFGSSSGAVFGAWLAGRIIRTVGVDPLLPLAAAILLLSLLVFNAIDRRERAAPRAEGAVPRVPDVAIGRGNAFALVSRSRYLLLMAAVIFLLNWVNSAGEYILSAVVKRAADAEVLRGALPDGAQGRYIGAFFADYFQPVSYTHLTLPTN